MMSVPDSGQSGLTLQFVEGSLTLAGMLFAVGLPRMGAARFQAIERFFGGIARKRHQSLLLVGLSVIVLRVAMLPLLPVPLPFVPDDFSFLLSADTFLHGRLTNPTPAMWRHFETIHVTMQPTYASMYFPAVGLLLALSKAVLGHPWFGILGVTALMCAAICWMLQAWVPPQWALLGGLLAVMHLGLFSYWVNTYTGGGSIAGLGGALILGALPRILRKVRFRHLLLLAIGVVLVGFTRPYEGTLLCLPVAVRLGIWLVRGKNLPSRGTLLKMAALPLALVVGAVTWLGYYDYRNFGSATTLPYTVNRATYAIAPYFVWQNAHREPTYRHAELKRFYRFEAGMFVPDHSVLKIAKMHAITGWAVLTFFCGFSLLPPLFFIPWALMDRRVRFLSVCLLLLGVGLSVEVFLTPNYVAPFAAAIYGLGIQAMRHLSAWRLKTERVGKAIVCVSLLICVVMVAFRPFNRMLGMPVQERPFLDWNFRWYGPDHFGTDREGVQEKLEGFSGKQLAIVRYAPTNPPLEEWVYNGADINGSKVIWAQDMDAGSNRDLLHYYEDRKAWLVEPDHTPALVSPYPGPGKAGDQPQNAVEGASHPLVGP